ncbi:MAG TPA: GNAT family N-acetyltransferase [Candidatus Limnocylindrales bacterium]|jgi:GNAT superfamily N-acetyltransferase|nr:GNAT family N-acetyltransferase [Candidatus Limnocylindrales bacterium]
MAGVVVRHADDADRAWVADQLAAHHWRPVARRGSVVDPLDHPVLVAEQDGERVGHLSYVIAGGECEILTLLATRRRSGIGSALVEAVRAMARERECRRLWVLTTNDNLDALRFYQRRGFRLSALRPGAVDDSRARLKPTIPPLGEYGIPIRDEIELTQEL